MTERAYLYIVLCADGRLYVGTTRTSLELRVAQHNDGTFGGYTLTRRPVKLLYSQWFERITDAIESERRLKKMESRQERGLDPRRSRCAAGSLSAQNGFRGEDLRPQRGPKAIR